MAIADWMARVPARRSCQDGFNPCLCIRRRRFVKYVLPRKMWPDFALKVGRPDRASSEGGVSVLPTTPEPETTPDAGSCRRG